MKNVIITFILFTSLITGCNKKEDKKDPLPLLILLALNQPLQNIDFLTPKYYTNPNGDPLKTTIDNFLIEVRKVQLQKPVNVSYTIPSEGVFTANKGNQYHHSIDLHPSNGSTNIDILAAHDGVITRCQTQGLPGGTIYRHFISISSDVKNGSGTVVGKLVTIYGHLALDLDTGMPASGATVTKGQTISQNLYSGTVGGPHLHFEVRYYRPGDNVTNTCTTNGTSTGLPEFYAGTAGSTFTESSAGQWKLGYWDNNVAYGYGYPGNHGLSL